MNNGYTELIKEGNSQNVVEWNVGGNVVIFRNKVDIFLTANASVKPKDQQGLKKRKKKHNVLQFNPQLQIAIRGH